MSQEQTADKLVDAYINLRAAIHEKDEEIKELKQKQEYVTEKLMELFADQNLDSVRTPFGTATRRVQSTYWTSDWHAMHEFIKENDAFHLLEKRIHNGNMREFLEDNPDKLPIGLQSNNRYVISVRKPSK